MGNYRVKVDVKCIDCSLEFKGFEETLRCKECNRLVRNKRETAKNRLKGVQETKSVPMVVVNSKGLIIGETKKPINLREWFMINTKYSEKMLHNKTYSYNYLDSVKKQGRLGHKFLCYWLMYKEDYTLENAVKVINYRPVIEYLPKPVPQEKAIQVVNVFKELGLYKDIAKKYGMSKESVSHIKTGYQYSGVTGKVYKRRYKTANHVKN